MHEWEGRRSGHPGWRRGPEACEGEWGRGGRPGLLMMLGHGLLGGPRGPFPPSGEGGPDDERGWFGPRGPRRGEHRGPGFWGHGPGPWDERGGRARRGEMRYLVLDALRERARHGYEIIRTLEERSDGQYSPSPGSIYPILQYLEDLAFVVARQEDERKVFALTETGAAELAANQDKVDAFWARFGSSEASGATEVELRSLREDAALLFHALRDAAHAGLAANNAGVLRRLRGTVAECREAVRQILADVLTDAPRAGDGPPLDDDEE